MIRRKQKIKTPSTWSGLGWIERIILVFGPILLIIIILIMLGVIK